MDFLGVNVHCIWRGLAKLLNIFIFNTKQQWRLYGACLRSFVMHNCAHICRCLYSMQLSGFHTVNFILEAMSLKRQCHNIFCIFSSWTETTYRLMMNYPDGQGGEFALSLLSLFCSCRSFALLLFALSLFRSCCSFKKRDLRIEQKM